jgi:hypothetical protein
MNGFIRCMSIQPACLYVRDVASHAPAKDGGQVPKLTGTFQFKVAAFRLLNRTKKRVRYHMIF